MLYAKANLLNLLELRVSCDCKRCSGSGWLSSCGRYLYFSGFAASAKVAVCFETRKKHSKQSEHHVEFFLVESSKETARL